MTTTQQPPRRQAPNKFRGKCGTCSKEVLPQAGVISLEDGKWVTTCRACAGLPSQQKPRFTPGQAVRERGRAEIGSVASRCESPSGGTVRVLVKFPSGTRRIAEGELEAATSQQAAPLTTRQPQPPASPNKGLLFAADDVVADFEAVVSKGLWSDTPEFFVEAMQRLAGEVRKLKEGGRHG